MPSLLWLTANPDSVLAPYGEFVEFARSCGIEVLPLTLQCSLGEMQEHIKRADGYILSDIPDVVAVEELGALVRTQIEAGKRLLFMGCSDSTNSFLINFDLSIHKDEKLIRKSQERAADGRQIQILLPDQKSHLCQLMMKGQEEVSVESPVRVWYGGQASPFLYCPRDTFVLKDDNFVDPGPCELVCGAAWPRGNPEDHKVICIAATFAGDPMQSIGGYFFPGIRANRAFVGNILLWLTHQLENNKNESADILQNVHDIESGLHDFVLRTLRRKFGDDWWYEGVPESIRVETSKLHERSKGEIPKDAALYLINFKEIIEKNWALFCNFVDPHSNGKKKAMAWLSELNEIRNRLSHPTRLAHQPITDAEVSFVREKLTEIQSLESELMSEE